MVGNLILLAMATRRQSNHREERSISLTFLVHLSVLCAAACLSSLYNLVRLEIPEWSVVVQCLYLCVINRKCLRNALKETDGCVGRAL